MPAKLKKQPANAASEISGTELPDLKAEALLSLTNRIEANFNKSPFKNPDKAQLAQPRKDRKKSSKKSQKLLSTAIDTPSVSKTLGIGNDLKSQLPSVPNTKLQRGKKRLRDGKIKGPGNNESIVKGTQREGKVSGNAQSGLEEDVLALGGTLDDYKLVEGAPSDSEIEGDDKEPMDGSHMSLGQDVFQFVQDLRIGKVDVKELKESSESEQEEYIHDQKKHLQPRKTIKPSKSIDEPKRPEGKKATNRASSQLYFEPQSEWHSAVLPIIHASSSRHTPLRPDVIDSIHQHAKSLLELESIHYASRNKSASSAHQFYSTIMSSGTLSDKISALTLSAQESPVHNMKALESLLGLARKRSRGQAVEVLGALKDLFGPGFLLPPDRKLRTFASQPGLSIVFGSRDTWRPGDMLPAPLTESHLVCWAYEDWLKSIYFEVLKILETWCNDEIVFARSKAVDYVYQLLQEKPEQEANLLRLLVNKLGDSDKKIASKTSYNILQLETTHPLMKPTIIASIESDLLFRPGQSLHAKYYATITLNQTVLSGKEENVARKLLDIYFSLFIKLLERPAAEKPAVSEVNATVLNSKGEVQGGGGASGRKARLKSDSNEKGTDTNEELREKMLSAVLTGVNRAMPYTTTDDESFEKHLDTLFRVTHSSNFNTSIQALMLIQQLSASHPGSSDRFYRTLYESLLDPRLLTSSKQTLYLNLLFRALKSDVSAKRVKAFSKRLLQVISMHQASFACGTLYLLRELEGVFASLRGLIDEPQQDASDEEENFQDVPENADEFQNRTVNVNQLPGGTGYTKSASSRIYDGRKRDPEYSNAERSCLWELTPFLLHFHPSVALFASKLISHEAMPPKPDLSLHTLIHFLDRFVYRNAKLTNGPRGTSIMQPMAGGDTSDLLVSARSKIAIREPVNSEAFWKMDNEKVGADEVFFHKYFSTMGKGKLKAKKKKAERKAENSDGEEENEDEIWKALVGSRPDVEGSDASEEEIGTDEFGSAMEDSGEGESDQDEAGSKDVDGFKAEENGEMMEFEDDEALLGSDDEIPLDLDEAFNKDQLQFGIQDPSKVSEGSKSGKKRRKLKNLPTFASADDYAAMLEDDE